MDTTLFEQLAEVFGADIKRWPEQHRQAAQDFMRQSPKAGKILTRHGRLDALLNLDPPVKASAALKDRILASSSETFIVWFRHEIKRYAMLFAVVAIAGAWAGSSSFGDLPGVQNTLDQIFIMNALGPSE